MDEVREGSRLVGRETCPSCMKDGKLARYDDGHAHCYYRDCGYHENGKGKTRMSTFREKSDFTPLGVSIPENGLPKRGLTDKTLRKFSYGTGKDNKGRPCHIANLYGEDYRIISQKLRYHNKGVGIFSEDHLKDKAYFPIIGASWMQCLPFGGHAWRTGPRLIITSGEIDAMAVCQTFGLSWPVWSMIGGDNGAAEELKRWIGKIKGAFEEVVLFFDKDESGQEAEIRVCEALGSFIPIKRASETSEKDASDLLTKGKTKEIQTAVWNASPHRPKSLVRLRDAVLGLARKDRTKPWSYPWASVNSILAGVLPGSVTTVVAGAGCGKSTIVRECVYHWHKNTDAKVLGVFLEEDLDETAESLIGIESGKNARTDIDGSYLAEIEKLAEDLDPIDGKEAFLLDLREEALSLDGMLDHIRTAVVSEGIRIVVLDHLSMAVAVSDVKDERVAIDKAMYSIKKLAKATDAAFIVVCHLKRPEGKIGFDEGLRVSPIHIRGSAAIEQVSDTIIAGQRDKTNPETRDLLELTCLKDRKGGRDGRTIAWLRWFAEQGRLKEVNPHATRESPFDEEPDEGADLPIQEGGDPERDGLLGDPAGGEPSGVLAVHDRKHGAGLGAAGPGVQGGPSGDPGGGREAEGGDHQCVGVQSDHEEADTPQAALDLFGGIDEDSPPW
jgi:twinkle protein